MTHLNTAKRILRYIKGTLDYGLFYSAYNKKKLFGYCDSDWAGDLDDRKSTILLALFSILEILLLLRVKRKNRCSSFNVK